MYCLTEFLNRLRHLYILGVAATGEEAEDTFTIALRGFCNGRNLPFRLQHQVALLVVMVPPSAVLTQLTAAGVRAVGSVGTVVHVAHDVRVAPLACAVAVFRLGQAAEVIVEITHKTAAYCIAGVRKPEVVVPAVAPII